jgi:hypothetical protein
MHFLICRDWVTISEYNYQRSLHIWILHCYGADSDGTLKSAYEENICYTESLYKIIKPKA